MQFLCFGYYDEKKFGAMPQAEVAALVAKCKAHDAALHASGHLVMVGSLGASADTKSIRPKGGKPTFTDGPFAETKEQIGAFFIIEAANLDEAAKIAAQHPAGHLGETVGWGIEVRPIGHFQAPERAKEKRS